MNDEFISEDDLQTFEGFLRYQAINIASLTPAQVETWKGIFEETRQKAAASPKVGRMKLWQLPGEQKYAVAIEDGSDLWLTLWVKCSPTGEVFILYPRSDGQSNPHASYHLNGNLHQKSFGKKTMIVKRQPRTSKFKGAEHLGIYAGHVGKSVGAECDPAAFTGVVKVQPRILGPKHGAIGVDLVADGCEPEPKFYEGIWEIVSRETFSRAGQPAVVITVLKSVPFA